VQSNEKASVGGPRKIRGRGIHYFAGRVRCPFAGIGSRGDYESNRLCVDDDASQIVLDPDARRIEFYNDRVYSKRTIVGDILFLADGTTSTGKKTPLAIHLKVLKKGSAFSFDFHRHMRSSETLVAVDFEPFTVIVKDAVTRIVALSPEKVLDLCLRPSLALRVIKAVMSTKDFLEGVRQDPDKPGFRVADLSVGFGAFGYHYGVVRAELVSLDTANAPLLRRGSPSEMLREGAFELKLTALSKRWLDEVIVRDLFVFGLDGAAILERVRTHGLEAGETLSFQFDKSGGRIVLGAATEPLPEAADVARNYLEFHLLGGLLAECAEQRRGLL
jgi:hypothetical protein